MMQPRAASLFGGTRPLLLHRVQIPPSLRVLVLAPHPDDFDAIGVTMRVLHGNGNRIDVAVVTSGASGVEDIFCSPPTVAAKAEIREQEQRASCGYLGLPEDRLTFLRLGEDARWHLLESPENVERIATLLAARRPDLVFLPHWNDTNLAHQRTYSILRTVAISERSDLVALLNRDPKTIGMRADLYTTFGPEEADWKARLLRFHRSQQQRNLRTRNRGFDERILEMNRQTASELGGNAQYAEAFEIDGLTALPFPGTTEPR
jgi:LmbE family N-acetylglucosaminyl deacetylase